MLLLLAFLFFRNIETAANDGRTLYMYRTVTLTSTAMPLR